MRQHSSGPRRWAGAAACSCLVLAYCLLFDYHGPGWRLAPLAAALGAAAGVWALGAPQPGVQAVLAVVTGAIVIGARWEAMAMSRAAWAVAAIGVAALASLPAGRRAMPYVIAAVAAIRLPLQLAGLLPAWLVRSPSIELWTLRDMGALSVPAWGPFCAALAAVALPMVLSDARSAPSRRTRVACWALAWLLLLTIATNPSATAFIALAAGLLWAAAWGGWLRRAGWIAILGAVLIACAAGAKLVRDRDNTVRNRLLQAAGEWSADRSYVWEGAARAARRSPLFGAGLGGFGRAYGPVRPVAWLPVAGIDRPYTALCDPFLAAVEVGLPAAAALVAATVCAMLRSTRRDPALSGALVAGCAFGAVAGHVFMPLSGAAMLALAASAYAGRTSGTGQLLGGERPNGTSQQSTRGMRLLLAAYLCVAAAACAAQFIAPEPRDGISRSQAVLLWRQAFESGSIADYEKAAGAFRVRWDAVLNQPAELAGGRAMAFAHTYAAFARSYAAVLNSKGKVPEADAYDALGAQLDSWRLRNQGLLTTGRR